MDGAFEHNGVRLPYEVLGRGDPVVFCHGLGGDRGAMKDLVGTLPGHQLIVWDCRGHGASSPTGPAEHYRFASFAEDLRRLLDHIGIRRAVIGGVSMGAAVSLQFAVRWPERVRGLVLGRPAWIDRPLTKNLSFFPVIAELLDRLGPAQGLHEFQQMAEVQQFEVNAPYTYQSLCQHFSVPQAVARSVRLDRMPRDVPIDTREAVRGLKMPALVVGTEMDEIHPIEFAIQWAACLPDGELVLIESKAEDERGHVLSFRAWLDEFLAGVGP